MSGGGSPPRLPALLARWLLSSDDCARLLDALDEEYARYQSPQRTRIGADVWYWMQVLRSIPALRRPGRWSGGPSVIVDLLHLSRRLRRSPVSAAAAILTLSVTLGAGAAIVSVVDAVLLRPPPFTHPDALVTVGETPTDDPGAAPRAVSYSTFLAWRERAGASAELEAFDPTNVTLTELGAAERLSVNNVTPGFLQLLGVTPALGRLFDSEDLGQPVAIVSTAFWRGRLGADSAISGRQVVLGGQPHAILGVLPEHFYFALNASDVWRPLPFVPVEPEDGSDPVRVVARLDGRASPVELARALGDVSRVADPLPARVRAVPLAAAIAGDTPRTLGLLGAAGGLALLIAFTNLAVLLMVRSIDRRRELAVRRALGARRSETARQLVLESLALVGLGIVGGVLIAASMTPAVGRFALEFGGIAHRELTVSWRAIGVVSVIALFCAFACGFLPTLGAGRWRISDVLRQGATSSAREISLRRMFVGGEVAVAFVLLVSMSLVGLSLLNVLSTDPGFHAGGVLKLQVSLPSMSYPTRERAAAFFSELQSSVGERLGADAVSIINEVPLSGDGGRSLVGVHREATDREAVVRSAGPGYFDVLRIPVIAGRTFTPADGATAAPRAVISASLAQGLFGARQPVGSRIWLAGIQEMVEVIGVAGDVKHRALDEAPLSTVYLPALQFPSASSILVVRSVQPDRVVIATVRDEVQRLDGDLPVYSIRSMRDVVAASPGVPARRLLTVTLAGFALLAVVLSAIGLFGIVAHDVARRRAELALRIALGADPMRILRTTLGRGALTLGSGLAVGAVLAVWAARGLSYLLFMTGQVKVLSIGAAAAATLVATGAAAVLPVALVAARSDPVSTLRSE